MDYSEKFKKICLEASQMGIPVGNRGEFAIACGLIMIAEAISEIVSEPPPKYEYDNKKIN